MKTFVKCRTWLPLAILLLSQASPSFAQVKPGDFITYEKADKIRDLVSAGVYQAATHGMSMKIVPTERVDWPPPYKDATEQYAAQVRLTADHKTMLGYVAGQPFPLIDPNDPDVAVKIMWNEQNRPLATDDYDLRFYDCEDTYAAPNKAFDPIQYVQIGHYAGYNLVGRTEVEPLPIDPDFLKSDRLWLFGIYPLLAPSTGRGTGLLRYRYADPNRRDDSWIWTPGARRLRRWHEAILSGPTGIGAWNPDHYQGFNAKIQEFNFRYLGEKNMLAVAHAEHSPEVRCATDGGGSACPENWEMRHIYIVEASPDRKQLPEWLGSKSIVYMDSEMWFAPYIDAYDRKDQLFQAFIYWLAYRDRPVPDARVAIYPYKREFMVGELAIDVYAGEHEMCYLPGLGTPERECWYINMGAVDKKFFDPDSMAAAALQAQ